uniref:Copper transport protein n=1 Tax=Glossina brevipalpis TaxID=37001 RepID=A0A1A9WC22_9MUSC
MDHDHDHNHGPDDTVSCPMIMTFHGGHCERILWNGWVASTMVEFIFSALAIFLMAFCYETLKYLREYILRQTVRKEAERVALEMQAKTSSMSAHASGGGGGGGGGLGGGCPRSTMAEIQDKSYAQRVFSTPHLIQTLLNVIQIFISYLLMLVFMTFNYWLCMAVVFGLAVGYFFFGWIKQEAYESECCQ